MHATCSCPLLLHATHAVLIFVHTWVLADASDSEEDSDEDGEGLEGMDDGLELDGAEFSMSDDDSDVPDDEVDPDQAAFNSTKPANGEHVKLCFWNRCCWLAEVLSKVLEL